VGFRVFKINQDSYHVFLAKFHLAIYTVGWGKGIFMFTIFATDIVFANFISSVTGALFGAGAAFYFNTRQSKKEKKYRNIVSLHKAKYLIEKIAKINDHLSKHINKNIDKGIDNSEYYDWEKITEYNIPFSLPDIDLEKLLFLLQAPDKHKKILDSIMLVSSTQQTIIFSLDRRNQCYLDYLSKTVERDTLSKDKLKAIIGEREFYYLKQFTEILIKNNSNIQDECKNALKSIDKFLIEY